MFKLWLQNMVSFLCAVFCSVLCILWLCDAMWCGEMCYAFRVCDAVCCDVLVVWCCVLYCPGCVVLCAVVSRLFRMCAVGFWPCGAVFCVVLSVHYYSEDHVGFIDYLDVCFLRVSSFR